MNFCNSFRAQHKKFNDDVRVSVSSNILLLLIKPTQALLYTYITFVQ